MKADVLVVGAGAAGLMAAIWAGRTNPGREILLLEGAHRLGAKILISGGGRCNVTHDAVDADAFAGSTKPAIRKVLRRFDVPQTVEFFRELGVPLKTESTGKLFPTSDQARTVLDALLNAAQSAGVRLLHPCRVESLRKEGESFRISGVWGSATAPNVVLATGGKSVPKTGSDGLGYQLVRKLGHSTTARIFPALVPLCLPQYFFTSTLSGLSVPVRLRVRSSSGKTLATIEGPMLCTHFGISGPAALDISRYYLDAIQSDPEAELRVNWLAQSSQEALNSILLESGSGTILSRLRGQLPERLLRALCDVAQVNSTLPCSQLTRIQREALVSTITNMKLPVTGSRGFEFAEVTAGGVPLKEIRLETMQSRVCAGLSLCGEICDVDGRIGGYNFQWAWSSGYVAGISV